MKIDVVDELHKVRRKHTRASSEEIEKAAAKTLVEIQKDEKITLMLLSGCIRFLGKTARTCGTILISRHESDL